MNEGTLGYWVKLAREACDGRDGLSKDDYDELKRLRAELRMERDVLKRSVALSAKETMELVKVFV